MRLLKQVSREYKGKEYEKYWIIVPADIIKEIGWDTGEELKAEIKNGKLVVEKTNE